MSSAKRPGGPEFEWDASKAAANLKKHCVAFEEAVTVFADPLARIFDDPDHSDDEPREIIIGHSVRNRVLLVCFTERAANTRLIHARRATERERQDYAKHLQDQET